MVCCGDVTNPDTLHALAKGFEKDICLVRGNIFLFDEAGVKRYDNIKYFGAYGRFELGGYRVGLCHEPFNFGKVLKLGPCDYVFYGHTHEPWEERRDNTVFLNPGTLGGLFLQGTFAVWDTGQNSVELKRVDELL